jgi:serine/threonine protein kinase
MTLTPILPAQITDRYEIKKSLGEGGFATVHRAWDMRLERDVAIKVYHAITDVDSEKIHKEARILATLTHPNIVRIYDSDVARFPGKPDVAYMVMEYLGGGSLRERLRPGTVMRPQDALGLVAVLAEALHHAHEQDILHLDIKPENILFDLKGRPVLTDFGIGRKMKGDDKTRQSVAFGTIDYASPEQKAQMLLGRTADIYSLGVVLFELLTGQKPLGPAPIRPVSPFSPPFPLGHPIVSATDLVLIVCKALAATADYRYETAQVFAHQLRDYLRHTGDSTGRLMPTTRQRTQTTFQYAPISQVQLEIPDIPRRDSALRHLPDKSEELDRPSATVSANTRLPSLAYSHQGFEVGPGALVEQSVVARGRVILQQDAIVRADVMSLTMIDVAPGVQARNLIAPEIRIRGPIRFSGSIFCRQLKLGQESQQASAHLPDGSELGGSLIFGKEFENIVGNDHFGRAMKESRPASGILQRPRVRVGSNCTMIAVLGEVDVIISPRQKQLNTVRVQGDVTIGHNNLVQRIYGHNVTIDSGCTVNEVYAEGKLTIGANCTIGYMRAKRGIELGNGVVISSPIFFTEDGTIIERGAAKWRVTKDSENKEVEVGELSARNLFDETKSGKRGGLGTVLVDHRLHNLYERIAPNWYGELKPSQFSGSGDQLRVTAPKSIPASATADGEFLDIPLDLTPADQREVDESLVVVAPLPPRDAPISAPAAATTLFGGGGDDNDDFDDDDFDSAYTGDDAGLADEFGGGLFGNTDNDDDDGDFGDDFDEDSPSDGRTSVMPSNPSAFPSVRDGRTSVMGNNPSPNPFRGGLEGGASPRYPSGTQDDGGVGGRTPLQSPNDPTRMFGGDSNWSAAPKPRPSTPPDGPTRVFGSDMDLPDNPKPRPSGERKTVGTTPSDFYNPNRPGITRSGRDKVDDPNVWGHDMEEDEDNG